MSNGAGLLVSEFSFFFFYNSLLAKSTAVMLCTTVHLRLLLIDYSFYIYYYLVEHFVLIFLLLCKINCLGHYGWKHPSTLRVYYNTLIKLDWDINFRQNMIGVPSTVICIWRYNCSGSTSMQTCGRLHMDREAQRTRPWSDQRWGPGGLYSDL